jgi:hypothetical protein
MNKFKFLILLMVALFGIQANSQNVGVGTTTPSHKLHVLGTGRIDTMPTAASTDSIVTRLSVSNGELRQMSIARLFGQIDTDGDGIIDFNDPDKDGDGIDNASDTCQIQYGCAPSGCARSCSALIPSWTTADLAPITSTGSSTLLSGTSIKTVMSFNTNAAQTVTAPQGATTMLVKVWGAGGGKGGDDGLIGGNGGGGAFSSASVSVSGGSSFNVFVANSGAQGGVRVGGTAGWGFCSGGNGGSDGSNCCSGGGGGGAGSSAIVRTTPSALTIAVAGAGGGGAGAGSSGFSSSGNSGGGGGQAGFTRTSGLTGGATGSNSVCAGAVGMNGSGGSNNDGPGGGGGGGGHTAGGLGGTAAPAVDQMAGGGGGGNSLGTVTPGSADVPGNSSDTDRISNAGNGQTNSTSAGKGLVVIYWSR